MRYFVYCRKSSEAEDRQMLSLESQRKEAMRVFAQDSRIEIVDTIEEAFSAKAPGRPRFENMLRRLERGEAQGIIAWHPDRLARNSIDGGKIIWFLDRSVIKDLKFATYTFENNPQGKFMLSILFGQSKYYVDALSENVKRGNRTKVEKGWRPNIAPIGYLNCKETRTIIVDPVRFPIIRRIFESVLSGGYSPRQVYEAARDDWGLRTLRRKKLGGKPVALGAIYRILTDPFYAGILVWSNEAHLGRHVPVVTPDEFAAVQKRLGRPHTSRPQKKTTFAFTGMIECGACGLSVTAEEKRNPYGSVYTYYHCTWRNLVGPRCRQPVIRVADLENQILAFLDRVALPPVEHQWVLREVDKISAKVGSAEIGRRQLLEKTHADIARRLAALTDLKLRDMIGDDEFMEKRLQLQQEQLRSHGCLETAKTTANRFELLKEVLLFSSRATDWFREGTQETKRLILQTVGSNLRLKDKILSIEARKPFVEFYQSTNFLTLRAAREDVRTFLLEDEAAFDEIIANIRMVKKQVEEQENLKKVA